MCGNDIVGIIVVILVSVSNYFIYKCVKLPVSLDLHFFSQICFPLTLGVSLNFEKYI